MAPNSSPSKASRTAAQWRRSQPAHAQTLHELPDQNTPTAKNAEYTSSTPPAQASSDPAFEPEARVQPLDDCDMG